MLTSGALHCVTYGVFGLRVGLYARLDCVRVVGQGEGVAGHRELLFFMPGSHVLITFLSDSDGKNCRSFSIYKFYYNNCSVTSL